MNHWIGGALLCVLAAAGMMACANPGERQEVLPMTLGNWRRVAVENIPAEEHSEELKRMGIKQARRGIYDNGQRLTVSLYRYGAPAVAFELVQKFRPEPGKIAFHKGPYFVVLDSQAQDRAALDSFASLLEGVLNE